MSTTFDPGQHACRLDVLEGERVVYTQHLGKPLEVGRQDKGEPEPVALCTKEGAARLIIATHHETSVARRQLRIEFRADGRIELTNLSPTVPIRMEGEDHLAAGKSRIVAAGATLCFGERRLALVNQQTPAGLNSLPDATLAPGRMRRVASPVSGIRLNQPQGGDTAELVRALQVTIDIFQRASTAREFFASAVEGAIELVGLHEASIVLYRDGAWSDAFASCDNPRNRMRPASRKVLANVLEHKRTFWDDGLGDADSTESLAGVDAVTAAPILDARGDVIGALYGDRRQTLAPGELRPITGLDAMLLELLACGVASGLARLQQEDTARKMRLQFEQFFTRELARELEACPDLLDGREVDATILFCDIRGFSRISGRIGSAAATFPWINDVLETLSECVTQHGGVLVDYIGDELMAMWGAPQSQPDHAERACRAAADMLLQLPTLNARWRSQIGEAVEIGIGINSGRVRAGNTGSKQKFKYGPLGSPVNVASRAQGATKYYKTRILITGETADRLGAPLPVRRIGDVRMVNIAEPVRLFELMPHAEASTETIRTTYEHALAEFEQKRFRQSAAALAPLLNLFADDGPSLVLLTRAVNAMVNGPDAEHPVWLLPGK